MASLLWTVLLVCLVAPWVEGADKELGEDCASSDTCVHPTLETVCDQEKTCKIKHGQACDGDGHSTLCVAGAECTSNTCTCKTTVYTADTGTGKCTAGEDEYGGTCPNSGSGPCTGNLECVDSICLCTQSGGFNPDLSDGTCAAVAAKKVGKTCTVADVVTDCETTQECVGSPLECTCKSGSAGPRGGDCAAVAAKKVGKTCTVANVAVDCETTQECVGSPLECTCKTGFAGPRGGDCDPANNNLGGGCSTSTGCAATDANSECDGTPKKCQCKAGYSESSGTCVVAQQKVGRVCTPSTATANDKCGTLSSTHLECTGDSNTTCACGSGYTGNKAEACAAIAAKKVGKLCTPGSSPGPEDDTVCGASATTFLECTGNSNTECACKSGYTGDKGGTCTKKSDSGASGLVGSLVAVTLAAISHVFMRH